MEEKIKNYFNFNEANYNNESLRRTKFVLFLGFVCFLSLVIFITCAALEQVAGAVIFALVFIGSLIGLIALIKHKIPYPEIPTVEEITKYALKKN